MTATGLFHTFLVHICEFYYWQFERFTKRCSNSVNYWARKLLFFSNGYHYQGYSPAPTCIVRYQTLTKTPTSLSITSKPSVGWGRRSLERVKFYRNNAWTAPYQAQLHRFCKQLLVTQLDNRTTGNDYNWYHLLYIDNTNKLSQHKLRDNNILF